MKRALCVWFVRWPIQRFRHAQPARSKQALVLHAPAGRGQMLVTAVSPRAAQQGIVPGMPLAEAIALKTDAHFALHEPQADREALRALALWCQRFSPVVAMEEGERPESLLLDIKGCGHLFGGEKALAAQLRQDLRRHGYWARAAIADTIGAAWAVAHYGTEPGVPRMIAPGGQAEALRPLAVEALRLSGTIVEMLHQFDIRVIDQLLALPRAALPSRFGPEVMQRIEQALGNVFELLTPEKMVEPIEASWEFEPPTADRRSLEKIFEHLMERILERLPSRLLGIQQLLCSLRTTSGETVPLRIGLLRPSACGTHLMGLVRLHLERLRVPDEVAALVVRADEVAPVEFTQGQFFDEEPADRRRKLPVLIERLSGRLGAKAVLRPRIWPDAQPECACRFEPWLQQEASKGVLPRSRLRFSSGDNKPLPRPSSLKPQPVNISVVSLIPGGPPLRFQWQERSHVVAHAWGPERIETGWWRGNDVHRDYYLVETTTGKRFWLFRTMGNERWFLHGTFG